MERALTGTDSMTAIWAICAVALSVSGFGALIPLTTDPRPAERRGQTAQRRDRAAHRLVSVLVPAYNEEAVIECSVRAILASEYPSLEVIVVDDGSEDGTAAIIGALAREDARLRILHQTGNCGKAAALNAGLAIARSELVVVIDADTAPHPTFVGRMIQPLLEGRADAVAGNVRVAPRPGIITAWQRIEYTTILNRIRLFQGYKGSITTIAGAAGAMRRSAVLSVGGYSGDTRAEDADLTLKMMGRGYRIVYLQDAIVDTCAPVSWRALLHQRTRWIYGNIQCISRHLGRRSARWPRPCGLPVFAFENLVKPPLEFIRAVIPVLVMLNFLPAALLYGYMLVFALHAISVPRAFSREAQRPPGLTCICTRYMLWPLFAGCPYIAALCKLLTRAPVAWRKPAHQPLRAHGIRVTR